MFFLWGSKRASAAIRNIGYLHCDQCGTQQSCSTRLDYTVRHFWYAVRFVTGKTYTAFCDVCRGRVGLLDPKVVEGKLKKNPIPFLDRWGWAFATTAFAGLIAFALFEDGQASKRDVVYLAAPHTGDLYLITDDSLAGGGCRDCRYGSALVSSVQAGGVYVRFSKTVSNRSSYARDPQSFQDKPEFISSGQLQGMKARGVISRVDRP